ncbi:MAG: hypothetical protein HKN73_13155 [Gemmatimonadetes bacterium]|nr:hypothetical protein [Gemmatimonadota bacterium]
MPILAKLVGDIGNGSLLGMYMAAVWPTLEYRVERPAWAGCEIGPTRLAGDGPRLYGEAWGEVLRETPRYACLAIGSGVAVYPNRELARSVPQWPRQAVWHALRLSIAQS